MVYKQVISLGVGLSLLWDDQVDVALINFIALASKAAQEELCIHPQHCVLPPRCVFSVVWL